MNHLEVYQAETFVSDKEANWLQWCADVQKMLGHGLDGDQVTDGYSMDCAFVVFESGMSADTYAWMTRRHPSYHNWQQIPF